MLSFRLFLMYQSQIMQKTKSRITNHCYNIILYNCLCIYPHRDVYFFIQHECPSVSVFRTLLRICYRDLVLNSLSFHLSDNILIFSSVLNYSFAGYGILDLQGLVWFPSQHFESASLLASKLFDEKPADIQKQRHYFANKGSSSQGYGFSCGHVWM